MRHGSSPLKHAQTRVVKAAQPVIDQIALRIATAYRKKDSQPRSDLHSALEIALGMFGSSVLTPREGEVLRKYLHGHSTRSIAQHLDVTEHTISMHRKNAYAKLDVRSQYELFHLFIDSLSCFDASEPQDSLIRYLERPSV